MLAVVEDQVPQVLLFQFSIGDAGCAVDGAADSGNIHVGFDSLLEMR